MGNKEKNAMLHKNLRQGRKVAWKMDTNPPN